MRSLLAVLLVSVLVGGPALAQGFGEGRFGPPPEAPGSEEAARHGRFFYHDQELKIALIGAFLLGAAALIRFGRPRWRPLFLLLSVAVLGFAMGGFLCPTSAVQNVILKGVSGYLVLFLLPVLAALLVGRLFCGYVCPFGALQELIHIRKWSIRLPPKFWKAANFLRYAVLVYLVARVLYTNTLGFEDFSPFKPLFSFGGTAGALAFTAAFALLSVVTFRPFCRTLCPYGALLSLLSRISLFRLSATKGCTSCGLCAWVCPTAAMGKGAPDMTECFLCGLCRERCPRGALRFVPRFGPSESGG